MGKKYFDTKKGTLESSILGVWKTAAEENAVKMDGRTKGYKTHREKLEAARLRRETNKKSVNEKQGFTDEELDRMSDEEFDFLELSGTQFEAAMKKKSAGDRAKAKKKRAKYMKTAGGKKAALKSKKRAAKVRKGTIKVDKSKSKAAKKRAKLYAGDGFDEGTKEEYQKFFNAAMKKFGIDSPADLKSDEEKKKFYDYIDKNYKGEKDEELKSLKSELELDENFGVHEDIPAMEVGTDRYRDYVLEITPGEENPEWVKARDFKVQSMREALMKVWELDEKKDEPAEEEDEKISPVKGKKTMTGGKIAKVDTKPTIDG
jgi:hypothetical protein